MSRTIFTDFFNYSMISLGAYLQSCAGDPQSPLHTNDQGDFRLTLASLTAYAQAQGASLETTPILDIAKPGWLDAYYRFLLQEYQSNKSRRQASQTPASRVRWAQRYLKCLRKVINRAIRLGYLPNVDYLSLITPSGEYARKQGVEEASNASLQLAQLSKSKVSYRVSVVGEAEDAHSEYELAMGAADLYLLCLYCGGLELEEFYNLTDADISKTSPSIRLPWAGIRIDLSQTIYSALVAYRRMPQFGKRTTEIIANALRAANSRLFLSQSIFIDWLRFAKDQGIPEDHLLRLIEARQNPGARIGADLRSSIQKVVYRMGTYYNKFKKQWYCIYTHKCTGEDKYLELINTEPPLLPNMKAREADFYYPNTSEITAHKVQGKKVADPLGTTEHCGSGRTECQGRSENHVMSHFDQINIQNRLQKRSIVGHWA